MATIPLSDYIKQIEDLIERENFDRAIALSQHGLRTYSRCVHFYRLLGQACMLSQRPDDAGDMFRRVLGADPENVVAYIGLGEVADGLGATEEAIWQYERALELEPFQTGVRDALQRLRGNNGRKNGSSQRIKLSRSALGRIYMRGELYREAAQEFRMALSGEAAAKTSNAIGEASESRFDLRVALAEALYRGGQQRESATVCEEVMKTLPNALKANLILGAIWHEAGRDGEAQTLFERAQALDPENVVASQLNIHIPVVLRDVQIEEPTRDLLFPPPAAETTERKPSVVAAPVAAPSASEAYSVENEEGLPDWLKSLNTSAPQSDIRPGTGPLGKANEPDWLTELQVRETPPAMPAAPSATAGGEMDWLTTLTATTPAAPPTTAASKDSDEHTPDWLQTLRTDSPSAGAPAVAPAAPSPTAPPPAEETPDWLKNLRSNEEVAPAPAPVETTEDDITPDWLKNLQAEDSSIASAPAPTAVKADEGLDWLASLRAETDSPSPVPDQPPSPQTNVPSPPIARGPEPPPQRSFDATTTPTSSETQSIPTGGEAYHARLERARSLKSWDIDSALEQYEQMAGASDDLIRAALIDIAELEPFHGSNPRLYIVFEKLEKSLKNPAAVLNPPDRTDRVLDEAQVTADTNVAPGDPSVMLANAEQPKSIAQESALTPTATAASELDQMATGAAEVVFPLTSADGASDSTTQSPAHLIEQTEHLERLKLARTMKDVDLESALELYALMHDANQILRLQAMADLLPLQSVDPRVAEVINQLQSGTTGQLSDLQNQTTTIDEKELPEWLTQAKPKTTVPVAESPSSVTAEARLQAQPPKPSVTQVTQTPSNTTPETSNQKAAGQSVAAAASAKDANTDSTQSERKPTTSERLREPWVVRRLRKEAERRGEDPAKVGTGELRMPSWLTDLSTKITDTLKPSSARSTPPSTGSRRSGTGPLGTSTPTRRGGTGALGSSTKPASTPPTRRGSTGPLRLPSSSASSALPSPATQPAATRRGSTGKLRLPSSAPAPSAPTTPPTRRGGTGALRAARLRREGVDYLDDRAAPPSVEAQELPKGDAEYSARLDLARALKFIDVNASLDEYELLITAKDLLRQQAIEDLAKLSQTNKRAQSILARFEGRDTPPPAPAARLPEPPPAPVVTPSKPKEVERPVTPAASPSKPATVTASPPAKVSPPAPPTTPKAAPIEPSKPAAPTGAVVSGTTEARAPREATLYLDDSSAPASIETQALPEGEAQHQAHLDLARMLKDIDVDSAAEQYALLVSASEGLRQQAIADLTPLAGGSARVAEVLTLLQGTLATSVAPSAPTEATPIEEAELLVEPAVVPAQAVVEPSPQPAPVEPLAAELEGIPDWLAALKPGAAPQPLEPVATPPPSPEPATPKAAEARAPREATLYLDDSSAPASIETQALPEGEAQHQAHLDLARMLKDIDVDSAVEQYALLVSASEGLQQQAIADLMVLSQSNTRAQEILQQFQTTAQPMISEAETASVVEPAPELPVAASESVEAETTEPIPSTDVPDWLAALKPPAEAALTETANVVDAGHTVESAVKMPDWLVALKPDAQPKPASPAIETASPIEVDAPAPVEVRAPRAPREATLYLDDSSAPPSIETQALPEGEAQYQARLELARTMMDLDVDEALALYALMKDASVSLREQCVADLTPLVANHPRAAEILEQLQAGVVSAAPQTSAPEKAEPPSAAIEPESEIPAWLAALKPQTEEATSAPTAELTAERSAELVDLKSQADETISTEVDAPTLEPTAEIPAWLAALKPQNDETHPSRAVADAPIVEPTSEIPSWLAELKPKSDEAKPIQPAPEQAATASSAQTPPTAIEPAAPTATASALPAWLSELQKQTQGGGAKPIAPATPATPETLPVATPSVDVPGAPPAARAPREATLYLDDSSAPASIETQALPQGDAEQQAHLDLARMLKDFDLDSALDQYHSLLNAHETLRRAAIADLTPLAGASARAAEVLASLQATVVEPTATSQLELPLVATEMPQSVVAEAPVSESVQLEAMPALVEATPMLEATEGLPDWLVALKPEAADAEIKPEAPIEASAPTVEATTELPAWLAELKPEPLKPEAPVEPPAETLQAPSAAPSSMPDWLAALQPAVTAPPTPPTPEPSPKAVPTEHVPREATLYLDDSSAPASIETQAAPEGDAAYQARLDLARMLSGMDVDEATEQYRSLVEENALLPQTIDDLQLLAQTQPRISPLRVLLIEALIRAERGAEAIPYLRQML